MGFMENFSERHQRLKERIHAFRMPLSKKGQIAMNIVYFAIPVVGGHYLMQWVHGRAQLNLREAGVLPGLSEAQPISKTENQNKALRNRLAKIKNNEITKAAPAGEGGR